MLQSQMQAGKTGVCIHVSKLSDKKYYWICGKSDNELKNQVIKRFKDFNQEITVLFLGN